MHTRITRTLLAAVAAGVVVSTAGFAAAGAASAVTGASRVVHPPSGGPPIYTPPCPVTTALLVGPVTRPRADAPAPFTGGCSGYLASGRDFRFAQAVITVPTTPCTRSSPELYINLGSADSYARAGIRCLLLDSGPDHAAGRADGPGTSYQGFFTVWHQGVISFLQTISLSTVDPGDGVFFSIYFNQVGNADHFTASGPGVSAAVSAGAHGAVYNTAAALADWTLSFPSSPVQPTTQNVRVTQFLRGRFTTANGQQGTFQGPWNLNPVEVTSNGHAPPFGTLVSAPSYLWTDGNSFRGLPGDAFGVWLYT